MYKNQLQELAQRSCFNLPSYTCLREGPDHAPRFKSTVSFNGESFQCPGFFTTLRQAEQSAAEAALLSLSSRSRSLSLSLAPRILDETRIYKNLLQEISQRVGAPLPQYTTFRSGHGHQPVFTGTVELTGISFTGEPAKNKKQAEKNAAMAAWSSLKQLVKKELEGLSEPENNGELEQVTIARALLNYKSKEKFAFGGDGSRFPKLSSQVTRPSRPQPPSVTSSKILPLICPKTCHRHRSYLPAKDNVMPPMPQQRYTPAPTFLTSGASPYIPIDQFKVASCRGLAPSVTIRTAVPVYTAPPPPPSTRISSQLVRIAPPESIRPAAPAVVDNLLLRMQQQESTPAITPLSLVNNLREPVAGPPRPVTSRNLLHMQKQEAAPVIAPSLQPAVHDVSPFKGLQESKEKK